MRIDGSPDMSLIEHAWYIPGQTFRRKIPAPKTLQALAAELQEEWSLILFYYYFF